MNKPAILIGMIILMLLSVTAITVTPLEPFQLPQLESTREVDKSGTWRTYLYCTWQIGNQGETIVDMISNKCPETIQSYTFDDDETYYARIDYATLQYIEDSGWEVANIGKDVEITVNYELDIPEPEPQLFNSIREQFLNIINKILCNLFGLCG